jgi:O-antigen ligase
MPAAPGLSLRKEQRILFAGFIVYSILILGSMATMSIGAAILGCCLLFTYPREIGRALARPIVRQYAAISAVLALACIFTLIISKLVPWTFAGQTHDFSLLKAAAKIWYLFWPIAVCAGFRMLDDSSRAKILRAWLLTFVIVSAIGVQQYLTGWPRPQAIPGVGGRFHATVFFGHHLSAASILIFPLFASLDAFSRPAVSRWLGIPRGVLGVGIALGLVCLFFGFSRALWVALPIGVIAWAISVIPGKMRWAAISAVVVGSIAVSQIPMVRERLTTRTGVGERNDLWMANLELFRKSPWVGVGWLQTERIGGHYLKEKQGKSDVFAGHAHNNFLEMLSGTGLLGTVPWLLWCVFAVTILFRAGETFPFFRGFAWVWLVFHLNGLTQVNFWEGKVLHQMMWAVGLALCWASEKERA